MMIATTNHPMCKRPQITKSFLQVRTSSTLEIFGFKVF